VQAIDLRPGDSLASVYRTRANQKGYLRLTNGKDTPLEHHLVISWNLGRRPNYPFEHVHHLNGQKDNNLPENLKIMTAEAHNASKMLGILNSMYKVWDERNPLYGLDFSGPNNGRYRKDLDDQEIRQLRNQGLPYRTIADKLECSKYTVMKRLGWHRPDNREAVVNHKVAKVEMLTEREDVYNGTVDDTHRYFICCGNDDAILSANCGELPLVPYGSCTLASINVSKFVTNQWTDKADVNWGQLAHVTRHLMRFLDNIIDLNHCPLPEIKETALRTRQIGIGVMGFADLLLKLGLRYGSPESATMAGQIMAYIYGDANQASIELGRQKGFAPTYEAAPEDVQKRRNGALVTCAPTGTLSLLAGSSSGIEPHFAFEYRKRLMDGEITVKAPIVEEYQAVSGNAELPDYFVTAHEVSPDEHLAVQAAFQQYVDAAVSKTINLPNNATKEDIWNLILKAHELGLKGLTVYRDGSRKFQALSKKSKQDNLPVPKSKQENGLSRGSI